VDYVGDVVQFEKEFSEDLRSSLRRPQVSAAGNLEAQRAFRQESFRCMHDPAGARQNGAGLHIKTAGTTGWKR